MVDEELAQRVVVEERARIGQSQGRNRRQRQNPMQPVQGNRYEIGTVDIPTMKVLPKLDELGDAFVEARGMGREECRADRSDGRADDDGKRVAIRRSELGESLDDADLIGTPGTATRQNDSKRGGRVFVHAYPLRSRVYHDRIADALTGLGRGSNAKLYATTSAAALSISASGTRSILNPARQNPTHRNNLDLSLTGHPDRPM
ncbi:hypothetical protein HYPGJ_31421 [Hyphomicrobium sp. GJ21]|nr:hypothetical protein HYPGJ_31421 [Hyphomicrobium sp. GJ21]